MVELSKSLHSFEQATSRLLNSSLPVASSTMASHRHVPLPEIPSITGSVPRSVPQIAVFTRISEQIRSSYPNRLPLPTTNSLSSSTSSPISAFTFVNFHQTAITSSNATVQSPAARIAPSVSTITQIRHSCIDRLPLSTANSSLFSNTPSVVVPTTKVLRTSITEPLPPLTRLEKPHPHASPDFQFEKPPTTTSQPMLPPPHSLPTPSSFATLTFKILPHTAQPQPCLSLALLDIQIVTPVPFHSALESSAITSWTYRSSTSQILPHLSKHSTSRTLPQLPERINLVPFPVNRTDSTGCSHFYCLPPSKQFVHTLEVSRPSPFLSTVPPEPPKEMIIHWESLLWPPVSFSDATKLEEENLDANRPHSLRPPLTQPPTNPP